jgi:hypothetical protein
MKISQAVARKHKLIEAPVYVVRLTGRWGGDHAAGCTECVFAKRSLYRSDLCNAHVFSCRASESFITAEAQPLHAEEMP